MTTLETTDMELLRIILQNMSYRDMLDWCNVNIRFSEMCNDRTTIVGQLLNAKRKEEVVAEVDLGHEFSNSLFAIYIQIPYDGAFPEIYFSTQTSPEDVQDMIDVIEEGTQNSYRMAHDFDDYDQQIIYTRRPNTVNIFMNQIGSGVTLDADVFKAILQAGLRAYNRGIGEGTIMIFADLDSRLIVQ